jgi:hypothetical protein
MARAPSDVPAQDTAMKWGLLGPARLRPRSALHRIHRAAAAERGLRWPDLPLET